MATSMLRASGIRSKNELNILILGETGVGKSTFINAFANYMAYETLDEAASNGLITVIPNSFPFRDTMITTGEATSNEILVTGKSATQASRVYTCELEDGKLLRIIDTPGVGDVEGIEKDKENFQDIMNTISTLDDLHGILILLKPNEARLTVLFRFCVSELLTHLHQSAAHNMMIGFTHTRATFFEPGATKAVLKSYLENNTSCDIELSDKTVFCFDSESYQYLAILNQGINLRDDVRTDYERSWDRSVKETKRMLDHVRGLTPHQVHETCSLNEARNLILQLTQPLAEITRIIQQNVALSTKQINELTETRKHGKQLQDMLKIKMMGLVAEEIPYPRTVCTDSKCVTYTTVGGIQKTEYTTTCHDHCYLKGIPLHTANDSRLAGCAAMAGKPNCQKCGHHYTLHMHVTYVLHSKELLVEDDSVKQKLEKNMTEKEAKKATIAKLKERIEEYEEEEREVEKAAALFGCFLKKNAIIAVSDARVQYLEHMIREEKGKVDKTEAEYAIIESLERAKATHEKEMRVISDSIARGDKEKLLTPTSIHRLISQLHDLPHFGSMIRDIQRVGWHAVRQHQEEHKIPIQKKRRRSTPAPKSVSKRSYWDAFNLWSSYWS